MGDGGSTVMATGGVAATMAMGAVIAFSLTTRLTAAAGPPLECLLALPAGAARTTPAAVVEVVLTSAVEVVLRRLMVTVFRLMLGEAADLGWMGAVADLPEKGLAGEREEEVVLCLALEFMSFLALLPAPAPLLLPPEVGVMGLDPAPL